MRKSKIICTIGPACNKIDVLEKLYFNGMNVARINLSHGDSTSLQNTINNIKLVREKHKVPIPIMLDTKGPEIRIKNFKNGQITLKKIDFLLLQLKKYWAMKLRCHWLIKSLLMT